MEATVDPLLGGPDWMPITPKGGPYSTPKLIGYLSPVDFEMQAGLT